MPRKKKADITIGGHHKDTETVCPNCGYCQHCGRANPKPVTVAPWPAPYYPYPWYVYPTTTAPQGSWTISTGGTDIPITGNTISIENASGAGGTWLTTS
jgi:hypothetical protein